MSRASRLSGLFGAGDRFVSGLKKVGKILVIRPLTAGILGIFYSQNMGCSDTTSACGFVSPEIENMRGPTLNEEADKETKYGGETPDDKPENFKDNKGTGPKDLKNKKDGSVWSPERSKGNPHGGSKWKRWNSEKSKKQGKRPETVREDGSVRGDE